MSKDNLEKRTSYLKPILALALSVGCGIGGYFMGVRQTEKSNELMEKQYKVQLYKMKIPPDMQDIYIQAITDDKVREHLKSMHDGKTYRDPQFVDPPKR